MISDPQTDSAIRRWIELLQEMRLENFEVGHALKRAFFIEWLKSPQPPAASKFSPLRNYARRIIAANLAHEGPETATLLMLRAGSADRELLNLNGLSHHLNGLSVAQASPSSSSFLQLAGIRRIFRLQAYHGRMVARALHQLRRHPKLVGTVRREFDLPAHFDDWFWLELEQALWRYIGAQLVLKRAKPRVLVSAGDNHPVGYSFHVAARQLGISSIVIQHGFIGQAWLYYPLWADKICVWGEVERQWYLAKGVPADKIIVTGNPRGITALPLKDRESLRRSLECSSDQRLLIWFTTHRGEQWMNRFVNWLSHPAMKGLNAKIILKLHPKENPSLYSGRIPDNISVFGASDLDLESAFVAADVIVHDHSSVGAEAHYCGQNVICAAVDPPYPDYFRSLIGPQSYVEDPDEMADVVSRLGPPNLATQESSCLRFGGEMASQAIANEIRALL
jgi:hypothetical protein